LALLACYALVNAMAALRFELWKDNAQAWLIARDAPLSQLFAQLRFEGHPFLWYILLMPFAKLGFPFETIMAVSMAAMGIALWLFATRSPFSALTKAIGALSGGFLFYLPVNARSYSLAPPLMMLTAHFYLGRHEKPVRYAVCLFFLAQIHVMLCALVGSLMLFWTMERVTLFKAQKVRTGASLASAGIMLAGVALLLPLLPGLSQNNATSSIVPRGAAMPLWDGIKKMVYFMGDMGKALTGFSAYIQGHTAYAVTMAPVYLGVLCAAALWFRLSPKTIGLFVVSMAWTAFVSIYIYPLYSRQRAMLLFCQLIFCAWIALTGQAGAAGAAQAVWGHRFRKLINAMILSVAVCTFTVTYTDIAAVTNDAEFYSMSKTVSRFIRENLPADAIIIADDEFNASPVAAYLGKGRVYNPMRGNYQNFAILDGRAANWCAYGDLDALVSHLGGAAQGRLYYLAPSLNDSLVEQMDGRSHASLTEIGRWTYHYAYEQYCLYEIRD